MTASLSDRIQQSRLMVVEVDKLRGWLRLRGESDVCTDLSCPGDTIIVTDDGTTNDLAALNPGDLIRVVPETGRPQKLVVVRRSWEEIASPET